MQHLIESLVSGEAIVAGVLSGTSGDGIDVVLSRMSVESSGTSGPRVIGCEALGFQTLAFPEALAPRVRAALDGQALGPRGVALLSRDLGCAFGAAARQVAEDTGCSLDLVGSHGLTIYHHDGAEPSGPASLQVGEGDHVAEAAGCTVVSDFRQRDLAAGGEGAPVSILADDAVFGGVGRPTTILNLGGLANLSWLPVQGEPLAFDTGPAGALLDGLARRLLEQPMDRGGEAARAGQIREEWLATWLAHPFYMQAPPKSTGRDTFGEAWVAGLLEAAGPAAPAADLLRSAVELVARTVALGVRMHLPGPVGPLLVAGGGVHNTTLMDALAENLGTHVGSTSLVGVDPDAREALVFAVLAARAVLGEPVTRTSASGARPGRILGKISPTGR